MCGKFLVTDDLNPFSRFGGKFKMKIITMNVNHYLSSLRCSTFMIVVYDNFIRTL